MEPSPPSVRECMWQIWLLVWHNYVVMALRSWVPFLTLVFDKEYSIPSSSSSSLVFWGWNMAWDGPNKHAYLAKIVHWENHESHLIIFWGSAGLQPLRISQNLALAEFSVKSFALCGEGCLKLAHRSVIKQAYWMQQNLPTQVAHLLIVEASRHQKLIINNFDKLANFLPNLASKTAARMLILAHFWPKLSDFEAKSSKTGWRCNNIESVKILLPGSTSELHMRIFL